MANLNFAYSSAPIKRVEEIQFGLFSPEEVKKFSVGEILYPEVMVCAIDSGYEASSRGLVVNV